MLLSKEGLSLSLSLSLKKKKKQLARLCSASSFLIKHQSHVYQIMDQIGAIWKVHKAQALTFL